jgi:hypothetical protein
VNGKVNSSRGVGRLLFVLGGLVALCVCGAALIFMAASSFMFSAGAPLPPDASELPSQARPTQAVGAFPTPGDSTPMSPTSAPAQPATGELRFDYPLTLQLDKEEIVQLEIVPDQPVALARTGGNAPAAKLLVEASGNDAPRKSVSYAIPLYPAMSAELATAQVRELNIVAGSETKQSIDPFDRNFWTWSVVAREGGEYRITLRLFGYNALTDDDPVRQVVTDTRIVRVEELPVLERLGRGLTENWLVLFGAGGPIALAVAVLTLWFARRDSHRPKG